MTKRQEKKQEKKEEEKEPLTREKFFQILDKVIKPKKEQPPKPEKKETSE